MFMAPVEPPIGPAPRAHEYVVVRLLRRWAAERDAGGAQLPSLVQLGQSLAIEPQAAIAVASLLQLTEHCLGRPLQAECCCSSRLSGDEQAVLLMLATAASHPPMTLASIPHGLPGALLWAVKSVRQLLLVSDQATPASPKRCPFQELL